MRKKYKVTMICREISRAIVVIGDESGEKSLEQVKDKAWAMFEANMSKDLEQENSTKVEAIEE